MAAEEFEICLDCRGPYDIGVLDEDYRCPGCADIFAVFGEEESPPEDDCS